ncbi:peroxisomal biogenesis factor 19-like isoform X2 [Ostrea edulis]|uniref:peroxisomal biogenesis factor 19-like isoform X2 n=1 Tax=Ostrea edulis TaxID=37623 RepID=UPI00209552DD|nr:peroxisomal biogenesis factor 19-like isoform X2 [Ostrea edulis]
MSESKQNEDQKSSKAESEVDEELDDLLESALKDFDKPQGAESSPQKHAKAPPSGDKEDPMSDMFAEEFSDEMAKQFQERMKNLMGEDPKLVEKIEKLTEAAGASESQSSQEEFAKTLASTIESMTENLDGLKDDMSDEDLMKAFTSMGMEEEGEGFMPMMQGMMKTLLSKEVLYPSLKELSQKYPKWIDENKEKVKTEQMDKYREHDRIVREICEEFEKEQASDTEDVKKLRFERIVDLMQQMQNMGQPPKEIVGDMAPGLEFDENGMPKMPNGCPMM